MKNKYNIFLLGFLLGIGLIFGDMVRKTYFTPDTTQAVSTLSDSLPLANESRIIVQLVDGKRVVTINFEDLQYIAKKKKTMRKTVENLGSLFKRLEE